jgi:hypothetical protein
MEKLYEGVGNNPDLLGKGIRVERGWYREGDPVWLRFSAKECLLGLEECGKLIGALYA